MTFDKSKVKTCVNADEVQVGDRGWFADSIKILREVVGNKKLIFTISEPPDSELEYPFISENSFYGLFYPYETQTETRVKDPVSIMQWLRDRGYTANPNGDWISSSREPFFFPDMWQYCEKKKPENDEFYWHPDWLEEVEI